MASWPNKYNINYLCIVYLHIAIYNYFDVWNNIGGTHVVTKSYKIIVYAYLNCVHSQLHTSLSLNHHREQKMAKCCVLFVATMCLASLLVASADWNILNQKTKSGLKISLRNYCESWRINVELNNIREFSVVPSECTDYIGKYMSGAQFKADSEATIEECTLYLNTHCEIKKDGKDAWIFDIDDTLLSTVPFYKKHGNG